MKLPSEELNIFRKFIDDLRSFYKWHFVPFCQELDEFFMSLPFGEDWAWYYEINDIYWIDESARDFMTPEDLKTVFGE